MQAIDLERLSVRAAHHFLTGAIAPRPIAWVSSLAADGTPNLAPYSFFNVFSIQPPVVAFSVSRRGRDGSTKDTLSNVEACPEVAISLVSHALVQQMSLTSAEYPPEVNEWEKAGLTPQASSLVRPPRVAEAPIQMEGRVDQVIALGKAGGAGNLVICRVLRMYVAEAVLDDAGSIDPQRADLMGRMGGSFYCRASGEAVFPLAQPSRQLGMGFDQLPVHIRNSPVLTGNDLAQLAAADAVPAYDEGIWQDPEVMNALAGNQQDRGQRLHRHAQALIAAGEMDRAWQVLLSE